MSWRRFASLWGPVLLQAVLLFYLSSLRNVLLPARSDKLAHFAAYALLGGLIVRALHGGFVPLRLKPAFAAIVLASLYGASDEIHQIFVPGRDASLWDLGADALGAAAAVGMLALALSRNRGGRGAQRPLVNPPAVDPAA